MDSDSKKRFLILFNCAVVLGIFYMLASYQDPYPAPDRSEEHQQFAWIEQGKETVKARLKDPDSVQFRNVGVHRNKKGSDAVCGEVNAHNSFGGYTGFEPFLVTPGNPSAILQEDMKAAEFRKLWNARCVE